eukprot:m.131944 g.131944  ORF g.131944 m.131944 type:complete len:333 (-) comp17488_c0_seq1:219-1217(-)
MSYSGLTLSGYGRLLELWDNELGIPMDLHTACACGDLNHVEDLIEGGEDGNARNLGGWTPLNFATFFGYEAIVTFLLDHAKADPSIGTQHEVTPLMWAAACNHELIMHALLSHGADVFAVDAHGNTALTWAVLTGQKSTLKILLDAGADIEYCHSKHQGLTPLLLAVQERAEGVLDELMLRGADTTAVDAHGRSAMDIALLPPVSTAIVNLLDSATSIPATLEPSLMLRSDPGLESIAQLAGADAYRNSPELSPSRRRRGSGGMLTATTSATTVDEFLTALNLKKYLPLFANVSFEELLEMDEPKLKAVGLSLFGPRRKIYYATQRWKDEHR